MTLQQQLCDQLRAVILAGRLAPGARLASSRALAGELACSRNTVVTAFDQLLSEGYLEGHAGSGTFVCRVLPEELLGAAPVPAEDTPTGQSPAGDSQPAPPPRLAARAQAIAGLRDRDYGNRRAFMPGVPDTADFPFDVWGRLHARAWRRPDAALLRLGDPAGFQPLREAIADYLNAYRGLNCRWQQVIITAGAQAAIGLVTQMLLEPGDPVWIEEPGYVGLRGALIAAGAQPVPVPLDEEGISVARGRSLALRAVSYTHLRAHET